MCKHPFKSDTEKLKRSFVKRSIIENYELTHINNTPDILEQNYI